MAVRVCNPKDFPYFIQHTNSGFRGLFGFLVGDFIADLQHSSNITLDVRTKNDGIGQLIDSATGAFDGCIGRLQRNESDVMMQLSTYPITAENIDQGKVVTDQVIQFLTVYNVEDVHSVQIESCFTSFSVDVWLLCLASLFTACAALFIRHLLREKGPTEQCLDAKGLFREKILYQVTTHMTGYGEISNVKGAFDKILYLSLSLFSFLVIFHFCAFIKTELVAARPPEIYASYKDLLDNDVALAFFKGFDSSAHFEFAPEDSEERKLWDRTLAKFARAKVLIVPQPGFAWTMKSFKERKLVFVLDSTFAPVAKRGMCTVVTDHYTTNMLQTLFGFTGFRVKSFFPFTGQDEQSKFVLKGIITSKSFRGKVSDKLNRILSNLFETGFIEKILNVVHESDFIKRIPGVGGQVKSERGLVDDCIRDIIYKEDIKLNAISLNNVRNLAPLCIFLLLIASYVLIYEIAKDRRMKKQVSCSRELRPRTA